MGLSKSSNRHLQRSTERTVFTALRTPDPAAAQLRQPAASSLSKTLLGSIAASKAFLPKRNLAPTGQTPKDGAQSQQQGD
jgi:hypothetical protein